jgi:hypothetical protein
MKLLFSVITAFSISGKNPDTTRQVECSTDHCRDVIGVMKNDNVTKDYVFDKQIYQLGCDTLPQVKFWQQVMKLPKDSFLVNIAESRKIVAKISADDWEAKSDVQKEFYKNEIRKANGLTDSSKIFITSGKSFFYDFDNAYRNIHQGIQCFVSNGVDPWYAQAILLIESPNKLQKSNVGAYGPFQLMKSVARMYGLKVNKHADERADFYRSAYAASSLLKNICIPKAKEMLDTMGITYNEQDVWFRLLVMHCYHAGAGNVRAALAAINPNHGGIHIIQKLWKTEAKGFRTASQNYSQLALAAMVEMDKRLAIENKNLVAFSK